MRGVVGGEFSSRGPRPCMGRRGLQGMREFLLRLLESERAQGKRVARGVWFFCALWVLVSVPALAQETPTRDDPERSVELRGWIDVGEVNEPRAYLCAEVGVGVMSLENCGTGAGILHDRGDVDLMHFRAKLPIALDLNLSDVSVTIAPGFGFTEAQRGRDQLGLVFDGDPGEAAVEVAGGEVGVGVDVRWWSEEEEGARLYLDAGLAYIPGSEVMFDLSSAIVPFSNLTLWVPF